MLMEKEKEASGFTIEVDMHRATLKHLASFSSSAGNSKRHTKSRSQTRDQVSQT